MNSSDDGRVFDGYARLYAPLALVALGLVFLPMLEDVVVETETSTYSSHYGTLWETAAEPNGGPAVFAIVLAFALMGLCLAATFRPLVAGLPVGVSVVSALVILMLVTKPGTGDPQPDLTDAGTASLAIAVFALLLGVVHAVHLSRRTRERTSPDRPLP